MKKIISHIIIILLISCSLSSKNANRKEAIDYYDSKDIITEKHENLVRILDFTGLTTSIVDSDLKYLLLLSEVEVIHLSNCINITDEGLKYLSGLQKLRILNLDETNITDAGLKYIKNLKSLQYLDLAHTKVTDKGIIVLGEMKTLRRVSVFKTKVTQKGVDALKKIHPELSIDLDGDQS